MTKRDHFPDAPVQKEEPISISRKAEAERRRNEKAANKRHLAAIEFVLQRFKENVDHFDVTEEQSEELKKLVRANRKYLREGKFDAATPSSIVKAYTNCHREGINYILDRLRRPSILREHLGYKALKQAFNHVVVTKPPPPPAHPDSKLPDFHPDKKDYDGLPWWSTSKPRYTPDKGEKLSMTQPAVAARESERNRIEHPSSPVGVHSAHWEQT